MENNTLYSNPRMYAAIDNWPFGSKRVKAIFEIEQTSKGERATRITENPKTGGFNKPKKLTYASKARIVDGNDDRTYIVELSIYGNISVMRGDMKLQHESIFPDSPKYQDVFNLFEVQS